MRSSVTDKFVSERLPPVESQAGYLFDLPELNFEPRLNCVDSLIQKNIDKGYGDNVALQGKGVCWTYQELNKKVNQIANLLTQQYQLVPGNRVLIRGYNSPMLAAIWLAVLKVGLVAVTTMPQLRARDLKAPIKQAKIEFSICQSSLIDELQLLLGSSSLNNIIAFDTVDQSAPLNTAMESAATEFSSYQTQATDIALIAFTSGTTGQPKGCIHYHRDILSMAICFSENILQPTPDDVFIGSPPLAFTFGLGSLLVFPLFAGASAALLENGAGVNLAKGIKDYNATISFTSPTGYCALMDSYENIDISSLRLSVAAGEHLSAAIYDRWKETTGVTMINGIGSTEMMHIFISTTAEENMGNLTGRVIPGYQACVLDHNHQVLPKGSEGLLAVKGPTGCKYLNDKRQSDYVVNGWNITGDVFRQDKEGRFWFRGRTDDMIVSSGYNISSIEVEVVVNEHPAVSECAVIGVPDPKRGRLVKAFVVLEDSRNASDELVLDIQNFVKNETSPYKYPRAITFVDYLPKTETGKIQRFKLNASIL